MIGIHTNSTRSTRATFNACWPRRSKEGSNWFLLLVVVAIGKIIPLPRNLNSFNFIIHHPLLNIASLSLFSPYNRDRVIEQLCGA